MSSAAPSRSPGRPRSAEADAAIFTATLELLVEEGFRGLSVEAVRQRAGVGKATIYRRFPDKAALVRATMEHVQAEVEMPDTGSVRDDLSAVWASAYTASGADPRFRMLMPRLLVDALDDAELFEVFKATLVDPRRAGMRTLMQRGVDRGELRADLDLELAIDMLVGPMIYRVLIDGGALEDPRGRALRVFDALMDGWAVRRARPSRARPRG